MNRTAGHQSRRQPSLFPGIVLAALALLSLFAATARADPASKMERVPGGLAFVGGSAPLLATEIDIKATGPIARVRVVQRFLNPGQRWREGLYAFPLPDDAAVDRMRLTIGARVVIGRIAEREEARRTYEKARAEGRHAGLVEQDRPNLFMTSIANIGPGEMITVELSYQQPVVKREGRFRLNVPLTLTPRYHPTRLLAEQAAVRAGEPEFPDVALRPQPTSKPINPVAFSIELRPGYPVTGLKSLNHTIERIETLAGGGHRVVLAGDAVPGDRDFELNWQADTGASVIPALFSEQIEGKHHGLLTLTPPEPEPEKSVAVPARELILTIDTSGSMAGESIRQARAALTSALSRLRPKDSFNLIRFDEKSTALFPNSVPADPAMVRRALDYVAYLDADGGTELRSALEMSLAGVSETGPMRQIVLITDAAVDNEDELLKLLHQRLGRSRLFVVAIGSAPNRYLARKAAEFGRGAMISIPHLKDVQSAMEGLFEKLERPAMTDVSIAWPDGANSDGTDVASYPARLPDLYSGDPLLLAFSADQMQGTAILTGMRNGKPWRREIALDGAIQAGGVGKLWARSRIAEIEDGGRRGDDRVEVRREIVEVALAHQLTSRFTSLIAIDETPVRPENETLEPSRVPNLPPAGWEDAHHEVAPSGPRPMRMMAMLRTSSAMVAMPQTATPFRMKMLVGGILLAMAGLMVWLTARRIPARWLR